MSIPRPLILIVYVTFILLLAGPIIPAAAIFRRAAATEAERFVQNVPATGPYTPDELGAARASIPAPGGQATPQDVRTLAESRRKLQAIQWEVWESRHQRDIAAARARIPVARATLALCSTLALLWTFAAWRMLRHARCRPRSDIQA